MRWWPFRSEVRPLPDGGTEWVVRMRSGRLSQRERRMMREWIDGPPENARDLLRAEAAWRLSGVLTSDVDLQRELSELDQRTRNGRHPSTASRRLVQAAIATLVVIASALLIWFANTPRSLETAQGDQRVATLADGSVVALNTNTRLTVNFSSKTRDVFLERGEVLFQVTPDAERPFIVHAEHGYVRAVGTRFNVLAQDSAVTVSVLEGYVAVSPRDGPSGAPGGALPTLLQAGQSAAYVASGKLVTPEPTQASSERIIAWREGKLKFDSWRVERAVREYNRYARKPIRLEGENAGDLKISGVFRIGDSAAFVQALGELIGARVVDEGDALVLTGSEADRAPHAISR